MSKKLDGVIGELRMDVGFAVCNVSSEIVLSKDFFCLGVGLIDVVLLEDLLIIASLLCLIGMNDILIILIEGVIVFSHFRSKSMISAHSLTNPLVFLCTLLIKDDEDEIETRQK